jgi:hypothetical protein
MMLRAFAFALVLSWAVPAPALACESAGPNAHIGTVTAIDNAQKTITLKDAESGKNLTFTATPELLRGIAVKDQVIVKYAADGARLRATSVTKS